MRFHVPLTNLRGLGVSLVVSLIFVSGCSDTERSWAYKYRFKFEEQTATPRMSPAYRTKEECESQMAEYGSFRVTIDRCVLQPPISLGWFEWETSVEIKVQAPKEPIHQEILSVITQTFGDCRKVRGEMLAGLEREMLPRSPAEVVATISASSCRPIYIRNRDEFTPLQVSEFEGVLVRGRVANK